MTELDLEIQKLRREVDRLENANRMLRQENRELLTQRQLDRAEIVHLRRVIEAEQRETEASEKNNKRGRG
ncbi:MAG: hypothetical protein IK149_01680 [Oscillospiraceae bacterium]|nr:hypothetical protein [Oscillospiraceae bacterium]